MVMSRQYRCPFCEELFSSLDTDVIQRVEPVRLEDMEEEQQSFFEEKEIEAELQCPFCLFTFTEPEWGGDKREDFLSKKMPPFLTAEKLPGGIRLIYTTKRLMHFLSFSLFALVFFVFGFCPIVLILNGQSVKINGEIQTDLNLTITLFSAIFLFSGSLFAIGALMNIYGKTVMDVSGGKCTLFRGVCGYGRRWFFDVTKKTKFCLEQTRDADESERENYIVVKEKGKKDFVFGGGIDDKKALLFIKTVLEKMRG